MPVLVGTICCKDFPSLHQILTGATENNGAHKSHAHLDRREFPDVVLWVANVFTCLVHFVVLDDHHTAIYLKFKIPVCTQPASGLMHYLGLYWKLVDASNRSFHYSRSMGIFGSVHGSI